MLSTPVEFIVGSLLLVPALLLAIPIHELGHGLAAVWAGDPSPRNRGYLRPQSLRRYLNVYGVVAVFLANVGWGNPIPVNEYQLRTAGRKAVWALGGPLSNLLAAAFFGALLRLLAGQAYPSLSVIQAPLGYLASLLYAIFFLNLSLFAFQLLPIPGLDGWRVVEAVLRDRNPRFFFEVGTNLQTIWIVAVLVVLGAEWLLHINLLGAAVGIFFEPASMGILGRCGAYVALDPCPLLIF
jgi:Zn-dependent protease